MIPRAERSRIGRLITAGTLAAAVLAIGIGCAGRAVRVAWATPNSPAAAGPSWTLDAGRADEDDSATPMISPQVVIAERPNRHNPDNSRRHQRTARPVEIELMTPGRLILREANVN